MHNYITPCCECSDRVIGCHSTCERYISWAQEQKERKEIIRKAKAEDNTFSEIVVKSVKRNKKDVKI